MNNKYEKYLLLKQQYKLLKTQHGGNKIEGILPNVNMILVADELKDEQKNELLKRAQSIIFINGVEHIIIDYNNDNIYVSKIYKQINIWNEINNKNKIIYMDPIPYALKNIQNIQLGIFNYVLFSHMYNKKTYKGIYYVHQDNTKITCAEYRNLLLSSWQFRNIVTKSIKAFLPEYEKQMRIYMYIGCEMSERTKDEPYFFVMNVGDRDKSIENNKFSDNDDFVKTCKNNNDDSLYIQSINFPDVHMIVPCYDGNDDKTKFCYLLDYIGKASIESTNLFWLKVAVETNRFYEINKKIYHNTHGYGVSYLHFRIETNPQYYNHPETNYANKYIENIRTIIINK
jgi:hypothetical protein